MPHQHRFSAKSRPAQPTHPLAKQYSLAKASEKFRIKFSFLGNWQHLECSAQDSHFWSSIVKASQKPSIKLTKIALISHFSKLLTPNSKLKTPNLKLFPIPHSSLCSEVCPSPRSVCLNQPNRFRNSNSVSIIGGITTIIGNSNVMQISYIIK